MIYRALVRFADLQDGKRIYEAGDTFPRPGFSVSEKRLTELAGSDNRAGHPLIAAEPEKRPLNAAKDEGEGLPAQTAKPRNTARRARNKG